MEASAVRKPEAGRHKGDLGGSVAKTGVRAGLSPQCLCGLYFSEFPELNNYYNVCGVFISYFGERGLKMGQYLFSFKFDSTSRIFLNTRPMNIFLVVKSNSLISSHQYSVQHFYKVFSSLFYFHSSLFVVISILFSFLQFFYTTLLYQYCNRHVQS